VGFTNEQTTAKMIRLEPGERVEFDADDYFSLYGYQEPPGGDHPHLSMLITELPKPYPTTTSA